MTSVVVSLAITLVAVYSGLTFKPLNSCSVGLHLHSFSSVFSPELTVNFLLFPPFMVTEVLNARVKDFLLINNCTKHT